MRIKISLGIYNIFVFLLAAGIFSSCRSDEPLDTSSDGSVSFLAFVQDENEALSRAVESFPVGYAAYGEEKFYVQMEAEDEDETKLLVPYQVSPGKDGQLQSIDPSQAIQWVDPDIRHNFYSWTLPWEEDTYELGGETTSRVSFLSSDYENMEIDRDEYLNCNVLERFIGARTGPVRYRNIGEYVELDYQHLVSKVVIESVRLVLDDGSYHENLRGTMTFYQMPQYGIFDRRPAGNVAPFVTADPASDLGVTTNVGPKATFYVCPGIDFSNMKFSVHLTDAVGDKGDYYGDFKAVYFDRVDPEMMDWNKDKSPTVLYAGEVMTIRLTMRQGNAATLSVNISPWSKKTDRTATGYPHQGIYSAAELQDLYNMFADDYTDEDIERAFELFGEEIDGERVIRLYDDCVLSHTRLPLTGELILDGMGHTVQIRSTSTQIGGVKRDYIAHVCCCRDIYITDGEHTIYIDKDYHIWIWDEEKQEFRDSGHSLEGAPLVGSGNNSYYIDYLTGENRATDSH